MDAENNGYNNEEDISSLVSFGRLFREQREAEGISIEEASQETFIDTANIKAIEEENFQEIGSPVFIRGYAKTYARYLGLDVDNVVALLEPHLSQIEASDKRTVNFLDADKKTRSELCYNKAQFNLKDRRKVVLWPYFLIILIIFSIAVFVGYRYFVEDKAAGYQSLEIPLQPINIPEERLGQEIEINPEPQLDQSSEIESTQEETIQLQTVTEDTASDFDSINIQDLPEPEKLEEPQLQANQRKLAFSFQGESWLQITGAAGEQIESRLFSANENIEFVVEAPVSIVMGNAKLVEFKVNDEIFDHMSFSKGNVARFTVQ